VFWLGLLLVLLWVLGLATAHTFGGFIYVLLLLGIIAIIFGIIRG
jgi:hypothetical protein